MPPTIQRGKTGSRSLARILEKGDQNPIIKVVGAAPVNAVAANRTLTVTGNFSNGETVVVGGLAYTFQTVLTNVARNVHIKGSAALSLDALKAAVNNTGGVPGTDYAAATVAHPTMEATSNTDTTQLFVARTAGAAGNALGCTETCANASFPGATLSGGVDGTEGEAEQLLFHNNFLYFTPTKMTVSTATWVKSATFGAL